MCVNALTSVACDLFCVFSTYKLNREKEKKEEEEGKKKKN